MLLGPPWRLTETNDSDPNSCASKTMPEFWVAGLTRRARTPVKLVMLFTERTTALSDAEERAAESLQLQIYALAWREMLGRLPARVELRFLESGVTGGHTPTAEDAEAALAAVRAAAVGIRARRFAATPSYQACRYCAYSQICPYTASRDV